MLDFTMIVELVCSLHNFILDIFYSYRFIRLGLCYVSDFRSVYPHYKVGHIIIKPINKTKTYSECCEITHPLFFINFILFILKYNYGEELSTTFSVFFYITRSFSFGFGIFYIYHFFDINPELFTKGYYSYIKFNITYITLQTYIQFMCCLISAPVLYFISNIISRF